MWDITCEKRLTTSPKPNTKLGDSFFSCLSMSPTLGSVLGTGQYFLSSSYLPPLVSDTHAWKMKRKMSVCVWDKGGIKGWEKVVAGSHIPSQSIVSGERDTCEADDKIERIKGNLTATHWSERDPFFSSAISIKSVLIYGRHIFMSSFSRRPINTNFIDIMAEAKKGG